MECAHAFAKCSNATRLKVGTVIVKNDRIISGYNAQTAHISEPCELLMVKLIQEYVIVRKRPYGAYTKPRVLGATMFCTTVVVYCVQLIL